MIDNVRALYNISVHIFQYVGHETLQRRSPLVCDFQYELCGSSGILQIKQERI